MATRGFPGAGIAPLLGMVLAIAAAHCAQAAPLRAQPVVLISGQSIVERDLPAFMEVQAGRFVASRVIQRACMRPGLKDDSLLLFLPDSDHCELIDAQGKILLPQRLHALSGRLPVRDPQDLLRDQHFAVMRPSFDSGHQRTTGCTCPGNTPPTGSVTCEAQTRTAGDPIGTVVFLADDADGDTLSGIFTYQHDADPVQPGLPAPLSSSCQPGQGTLQCTVNGNAPALPGILALNLAVSDGTANLHLDSLLEVLAPVEGRIFADGFELPSCP